MFCLSNVHILPAKRARLERKTRKKVCAELLLANGNNIGLNLLQVQSKWLGWNHNDAEYR